MARRKEDNLIPQAHTLTVEEMSRGGKKSGETRRKQASTKKLLQKCLSSSCSSVPQLRKLAQSLGLNPEEDTVHEVLVMTCVLNGIKHGSLKELEVLSDLLGENGYEDTERKKDDPLTEALKEEAARMEAEYANKQ